VLGSTDRLTREEECERILNTCGPDHHEAIFMVLDRQFRLLHNRAQVLLAICGVLLSTSVVLMTGKILGSRRLDHQEVIIPLLVVAGSAEIAAAAIVIGGVLRIRWTTQLPGTDLRAWILSSLTYRDSKVFAYHAAIAVLLLSMLCFQTAATLAWVQL
jgi:hypothetical protein